MEAHSRKRFLTNLGALGSGALLLNGLPAPLQYVPDKPTGTEPHLPTTAKPAVRVAHLTDIHIKPERAAEYGMAACVHSVNELQDRVSFIINGGDAIMNAASLSKSNVKGQWQTFHQILHNENSLPIYNCIGNHDLYGWMLPSPDHADGKKWCMEEYKISKPYYSFVQENWKFIVLDSVHARNSIPGYLGKLDAEQFNWLEEELKTTSDWYHVCVVSHIPILAICCLFDTDVTNMGKRSVSATNMHVDSGKLVELFHRYKNVKACISGHIHLIDYVNYLGVEYYCNGAVSGHWWKGDHQHFAPSYSIMNFYPDGRTSREVEYYNWKQ